MDKLISQQAAIDKIKKRLFETAFNNVGIKQNVDETLADVAENRLENWFNELPPIQPKLQELGRARTLLKAAWVLLNKQKNSGYVLNLLSETVNYDNAECDGNCLMGDIDAWFYEFYGEDLECGD